MTLSVYDKMCMGEVCWMRRKPHLKRLFKPLSLFICYALLLLSVSSAAGAFFYIRYAHSFEDVANQSLEQLSASRSSRINDLFALMNKTCINICYNSTVQNTMKALSRDGDDSNYFYGHIAEAKSSSRSFPA